jgi:N-acetylglucosaminyl-diphospho-decaprenol L-rhamnosyltransferase
MNYNDITVVFVSFKSGHIIETPISAINKNIKIVVIENSRDEKLKYELENKYKNVSVFIPEENKGNGAGINEGLKLANTKYIFYLDVDTKLTENTINELYNHAERLKDFSILAPAINNFEYKKSFFLEQNENYSKMSFVTGCALFMNAEVIKKNIGYFDEKIFLYYEENDMYKRCLNANKPIYLIHSSKIDHVGNASVPINFKEEIEINRNWHLMWSTFYFHQKHYGLIIAYYKVIFKYFSAILKILFFKLTRNKIKSRIYLARASGIMNSILGKPSWYRPKIN